MVSNKCPYNNIALPQNALVCKSLQWEYGTCKIVVYHEYWLLKSHQKNDVP